MRTDKRGELLADWIAHLDLAVLNVRDVPTFDRGNRSSRIDVTLVSTNFVAHVRNLRVCLEEIRSGHWYITYEIEHTTPRAASEDARDVSLKDIGRILRHIRSNIQTGSLNAVDDLMGALRTQVMHFVTEVIYASRTIAGTKTLPI